MEKLFNIHFEWVALATGILLMVALNPYLDNGASWCLFDLLGFAFCPGEGLGHSIAYTVRGDLANALQANIMGPASLLVITGRICYLLKNILSNNQYIKSKNYG